MSLKQWLTGLDRPVEEEPAVLPKEPRPKPGDQYWRVTVHLGYKEQWSWVFQEWRGETKADAEEQRNRCKATPDENGWIEVSEDLSLRADKISSVKLDEHTHTTDRPW